MANLALLSLGSNIEPVANLKAAVDRLAASSNLLAVSSVWETKPLGLTDQPNFLNAAAMVETRFSAREFKLDVIRRIERELGRVRAANKFGPRPIDIDIMLFNQDVFELDGQHIPDAEVMDRPFVAIPLAEIAPNFRHPETGQTLREIAQRFRLSGGEMQLRADVALAAVRVRS